MSIQIKLHEEINKRFSYVASRIKKELESDKKQKIFVIIPDQFNFEAQKLILEMLDTNVISRVEVLSFKRLVHRIYEETNYFKDNISNVERLSLISNIINEKKGELHFFNKYSITNKVILEINKVIKLITKNVISIDSLEDFYKTKDEREGILEAKIHDATIIYSEYARRMQSLNVDIDIISKLKKEAEGCAMLDASSIYIVDFYNFTNEQLEIIKILDKAMAKITLVLQSNESYQDTRINIFEIVKKAIAKFNLSDANISMITHSDILDEYKTFKYDKHVDLKLLSECYMYNKSYKKDQDKEDNDIKECEVISDKIFFNEYKSKDNEIFNLCLNISSLVKSGYRYKDINVVIKNSDDYKLKLAEYFDAFDIPYYLENSKMLSQSKIFRIITKTLEVFASNFKLVDIISHLKENAYKNLKDKDIYLFENYALKKGVDYYTTLKNIFEKELEKLDLKVDDIKNMMIDEISHEDIDMDNKDDDIEINDKDLDVYKAIIRVDEFFMDLKEKIEINSYDSKEDISKYITLISYIVQNVLDVKDVENQDKEITKLFEVLDKWSSCESATLKTSEFIDKLKVLIEDISISRMDETIDKVSCYDSKRVNFLKTPILHLVGYSNSSSASSKLTSLFSDKDTARLEEKNIEFNKNFKNQIFEERFLFFNMLEKVTDKLYISYTIYENGESVEVDNELTKMLLYFDGKRKTELIKNDKEECNKKIVSLPNKLGKVMFLDEYILDNLLLCDDAIIKYIFQNADVIEIKQEEIKKALRMIKNKDELARLFNYKKDKKIKITDNVSDIRPSFTALTKYVNCPFSYFLDYKLKVKERKVLKFDQLTIGNIAHELYEKFFNKLICESLDVTSLDEKFIESTLDDILYNELEVEFAKNDKNKVTFNRYRDILLRNTKNLIEHLKRGKFIMRYNELEFGYGKEVKGIEFKSKNGTRVYLGGKIDRADIYEEGSNLYIKIIDYKTGKKEFDLEKTRSGVDMQLVIYLKVLLEKFRSEGKNPIPAGIFYSRINADLKNDDEYKLSDNKLSGLVNEDVKVMKMIDEDYTHSDILPISFKKTGELDSRSLNKAFSSKQFEELADECIQRTKEIAEGIIDGVMDVVGDKDVCSYCIYKNICTASKNDKGEM